MISSTLLNLIMSIVTVGMLIAVLRAAHVAAGGRFEEVCRTRKWTRRTTSSVLRRIAICTWTAKSLPWPERAASMATFRATARLSPCPAPWQHDRHMRRPR